MQNRPENQQYTIPKVAHRVNGIQYIQRPKDIVVQQVANGLAWDEALSGAAVDVALPVVDRPIRLADIQWSAIRAGFPYHIERFVSGEVDMDSYPEELQMLNQTENPER